MRGQPQELMKLLVNTSPEAKEFKDLDEFFNYFFEQQWLQAFSDNLFRQK